MFSGGGEKTRYKANIAALKLLDTLLSENRQATIEEKRVLAQYSGWGAIPGVFDRRYEGGKYVPAQEKWAKEYYALRELIEKLSEHAQISSTTDILHSLYSHAKSSTQNAHYTSVDVIKGVYSAIAKMGFKGGAILEPSIGIGNFFGMLPEHMQKNARMYGIEIDPLSGTIAGNREGI